MKRSAKEIRKIFGHNRELIWVFTLRDIRDRYIGQFLGSLWSIGHPLFLMGLYVFIFAVVFPTRLGDQFQFPRSYVSFILAGLIPWLTFQEVMGRSVTVIVNNASLVKQIVFPVEVLPIKTVLASLLGLFIAVLLFFCIQLIIETSIPWFWLLFPCVVIFAFIPCMIGVSYILSAVGTYVRDLKDVIQIFITANLFMQPILYLPGRFPEAYNWVFYLNPFSYQVWVFQDLLYYGRFEHEFAWPVYFIGSWLVLIGGYFIFQFAKTKFIEVL